MPTTIDCAGDLQLAELVYDYLLLHIRNPATLSIEGDRIASPETGEHFQYELSEVLAAFVSSHHAYAGCIVSMHGDSSNSGSTFTIGRPSPASPPPHVENMMSPQG
jgi:hypothetical protein